MNEVLPQSIIDLDAFTIHDSINGLHLLVHTTGEAEAKKLSFTTLLTLITANSADNILVWTIGVDKPAGNTISDSRLKGRKVKVLQINNNPVSTGFTHDSSDPDDDTIDFTDVGAVEDGFIVIAFLD